MRDHAIMSIKQRETFVLEMILKDEAGNVEDLTSDTAYVEVGAPLDAADFEIDVTDEEGRIVITVPDEATEGWPVGKFRINVWLLYLTGEREVVLPIDLTVEPRL